MEIIFTNVIGRIKEQMERRNESVYAFAKALKLPQPTVAAYLSGDRKPSLDFVYHVCVLCNCSANHILGLPETQTEAVCATDEIDNIRRRADDAKKSVVSLLESLDALSKRAHGTTKNKQESDNESI